MAKRVPPQPLRLARPVEDVPGGSLAALRRDAAGCRRCPLWRYATRTVFGRGPARAALMLIGEQPGAREDLQGEPFVGPAGMLLRELLADAGIDPREVYLTNTVKHFKFEQRGKARLHKRANAAEQAACRPWLAAELERVRPRVVVALGAMAAQALFGTGFRVTRELGRWRTPAPGVAALATWHPSAILRMQPPQRDEARQRLAGDLSQAAKRMQAG